MNMPTFDELKDLAQRDPEGFERLRAELIDDCIRGSSERNQRRLRGLQFVIEARRRIAGSPMKALLDIQAMMHDSFLALQEAMLAQRRPDVPTARKNARVLHFGRSLSSRT